MSKKIVSLAFVSVFLLLMVGSPVMVEQISVHDVAVTAVTRSIPKYMLAPSTATELHVYPGRPLYINVTVKNMGDSSENFTVKAYYDNTVIGTKSVTNLAPGASIRVDFKWIPSDTLVKFNWTSHKYHAYPVKGEAVLAGDANPGDNVKVDGKVAVVLFGDVNQDGIVSGGDLVGIGMNWGKKPGDPGYYHKADVNFDCEISGGDLVGIGMHWSETAPDP